MKQHITKKQWDQLNLKKKTVFWNKIATKSEDYLVEPSIGQMIEFLGKEAEINEFSYFRTNPVWRISLTNRSIGKDAEGHTLFTDLELCDALWDGVKQKL